jgi:hypothetical protein
VLAATVRGAGKTPGVSLLDGLCCTKQCRAQPGPVPFSSIAAPARAWESFVAVALCLASSLGREGPINLADEAGYRNTWVMSGEQRPMVGNRVTLLGQSQLDLGDLPP